MHEVYLTQCNAAAGQPAFLVTSEESSDEAIYNLLINKKENPYKNGCMNNPGCESIPNIGSIPRGKYRVDVDNLDDASLLRNTGRFVTGKGDWGDWRVPLKPISVSEKIKRSDFFIHGGIFSGSAGCIDIGGGLLGNEATDRLLKDLSSNSGKDVILTVN